MRIVAFVDWGIISDSYSSNLLSNNISRGGYGLGLEWFSPVGPIQLMFAAPLSEQVGDKTSNFEFTMGQRF
jgi:outer membrane protein insertion porin family